MGDAIDRSIGKPILITTNVCGIKHICSGHPGVTPLSSFMDKLRAA